MTSATDKEGEDDIFIFAMAPKVLDPKENAATAGETPEGKTYKEKANAAFKAKKWDEAIYNFTKSLEVAKSHINYANRSAAYFQTGDYQSALDDANRCIKLKPDYNKGYVRKGSAYMAMESYTKAISAYKDGLKVCKGDPALEKGLAAARKGRAECSKANQAFQITEATQQASTKRSMEAKKAFSVHDFVKQSVRGLKLQMAAIQAQLELLKELGSMTREEKMELLFGLTDRDGSGKVNVKELADVMRRRTDEMPFTKGLEKAIAMVAKYDTNGDNELDFNEFQGVVAEMLTELDVDFNGFAEFLVLQILVKTIAPEVDERKEALGIEETGGSYKKEPDILDILTDKRLVELFKLFDKDGSRVLPFSDVAVGLYQATSDMDESVRTTMGLLLMMEKDDKRTLGYEQFGRLIMAIVAAAGCTFDDIVEDLVISLTMRDEKLKKKTLSRLLVGQEIYEAVKELDWQVEDKLDMVGPLAYARLQKLFDLWDTDGDGDLNMNELNDGLKKFQDAAGIKDDAKEKAFSLLSFDKDFDQQLGRNEFAHAMGHYARTFTVDLQELIDFMLVSAVLGEHAHSFQTAYGKSLVSENTAKPAVPKVQAVSPHFFASSTSCTSSDDNMWDIDDDSDYW